MATQTVEPDPGRRAVSLEMSQRHCDGRVVGCEDCVLPVNAHITLTDFGAENVASNPATARTVAPSDDFRSCKSWPSGVPKRGSRPDNTNSNTSDVTGPARPNSAACAPDHTPGASPSARVK